MVKTYCFDLDNTICFTAEADYLASKPHFERISHINSLYDQGNRIIIHTARGALSGIDHEALTISQLEKWGVKYHRLTLSKPYADFYVDDKAVLDVDFFRGIDNDF